MRLGRAIRVRRRTDAGSTMKQQMPLTGLLLGMFAAAVMLLAMDGCATPPRVPGSAAAGAGPLRAVWVTRWDYLTADDVRTIMRNCDRLGATDVMWQVRGQGDAYYQSDLEPWGQELFRDAEEPETLVTVGPGYDPLALAVDEAHRRGLRLHAWMNAMPLWKGTQPPLALSHPWHTHESWRLRDAAGKAQPLGEGYVIANPALHEFRSHIARVAADITRRYRVDGVHLDYIRYVSDSMKDDEQYLTDRRTLTLFRADTGRHGLDTPADRAAHRAWIRDQITDVVRRTGRAVKAERSDVAFTAAVWRRPDIARETYLQDAAAWVDSGLIDAVFPMIYTTDNEQLAGDLISWEKAVGSGRIVPGLGAYKHEAGQSIAEQIRALPDPGRVALFAYSTFFESRAPGQDQSPTASARRAQRRDSVARTLGRP